MKLKTYNLRVKDTLEDFDDSNESDQTVFYRETSKSKKKLYKVRIYLEGRDLPYVKQVKYTLHSTFGKNRVKIVRRRPSNLDCGLLIWTWGIFTVQVEIEDVKGRVTELDHYLTFGNQLQDSRVKIQKANLS
ncbi:hypothetical protein POV27_02655 [Aureisphaera galaxeae]|uniref:pYEATS domain-containing protein n=1 Tax=Aureisphaera galaxeae TaxID=1538023 RepID=UPI0023501864|nr:pYEATS domain-containing protein [Aureisphaera galaxeae]MDC8002932.1 hypothetical protein [Aureisphaera galaxeae]